jgi:hypothetical protein
MKFLSKNIPIQKYFTRHIIHSFFSANCPSVYSSDDNDTAVVNPGNLLLLLLFIYFLFIEKRIKRNLFSSYFCEFISSFLRSSIHTIYFFYLVVIFFFLFLIAHGYLSTLSSESSSKEPSLLIAFSTII